MTLTPEEQADIEVRFEALEEQIHRLKRKSNADPRIPLLATGFDIEDAIFSPCVRVFRATNQAIANNTQSSIRYSGERFDTNSLWESAANTRLTAKTAGKYFISTTTEFASNATGRRLLSLRENGNIYIGQQEWDCNDNGATMMSCTTLWELAVDEYVETFVYQTSGGDLNIVSRTSISPEFMMFWVAP